MSTNDHANAQPSLVHGHLQYVKGAVEETIGNLTGSESWKTSGHVDQVHAQAEMQAADKLNEAERKAHLTSRDPNWLGKEGKAEEIVGQIGRCGGLQHHGQEKIEAAQRKNL